MNSFLDFITKDIENKKLLISTLPTKTKTNIKKYNATIIEYLDKYEEYQTSTRNYLLAKNKTLQIKNTRKESKTANEIVTFEHLKFLLNPINTYVEKMGFDTLIYQINNYYRFNFNSLNEIINGFLDKFEQAGINLKDTDFDYTCYVHEYMSSFLDVRNKKEEGYDKVSAIFEQIYWVNPDLIEHIELNFRRLIRKYSKKFNSYINKLQREAINECHVKSYNECLEHLQRLYINLNIENQENLYEIVEKAKNNEFDINQYLEGNKVRTQAFDSLIPKNAKMDKVLVALEKLKLNVLEYNNYIEYELLFKDFKTTYEPLLSKKEEKNGLEEITKEIELKEKELDKLNKKIFARKFLFNKLDLRKVKLESLAKAKEINELYTKYDTEYFKDKVLNILNENLMVSDVLNLYFSYDYFKKMAIQRLFGFETYDEIINFSEKFDLYAMDASNIIISGVPIFKETNISRIIANKYRLSDINVTEDDLSEENLNLILNKILLILRVNKIENSDVTLDQIWFMVNVEKIINKEAK